MKGLTDIPGILVGHASDYDGLTGCTAILCEGGAVAGGDIRGSATGTEEWDVLESPSRHRADSRRGAGGRQRVWPGSRQRRPPVSGAQRRRIRDRRGEGAAGSGAILYDLKIGKASARPTREMGEAAAAAANGQGCGRRRRGRGNRRDGRKASGHEAGHEVGRRLVDGGA